MKKDGFTVRCPVDLSEKVDELAMMTGLTQTEILLDAILLHLRYVHRHQGQIVPPFPLSILQQEHERAGKDLPSKVMEDDQEREALF